MIREVELLAPAGDIESLIAGVQNGADAIYLGGSLFSARAYAKNFDNEQLLEAVKYAHLRNVKIYVTVNTLYKDEEYEDLINYIDYLYDIQVDALIIQDIGLFYLVKNRYKDFAIHMSTQASVMNKQAAKYFEKQGADRVVLARENTLSEIKEIASYTQIELEVFVHGALCVSYSGQCLMSSMIGKRSGNRGACAQPCRLNYSLEEDGKILSHCVPYLLSPKDLMTIDHIGELIEVGVTSFKIEGRMKRPEYVGAVVKAYRKAIDLYFENKKENLEIEKNDMKQMFNRNYTSGYLFNDTKLLDGDYPGNKGIIIGKVLRYNKKLKRATIKLDDILSQGDSVVFENIDKGRPVNKIYLDNRLVSSAKKNDVIEIEFDYPVYKGIVRKTVDKHVIDKIQFTYQKEYTKSDINISFYGKLNNYPKIVVEFQDIHIEKIGNEKCIKAQNHPLSHERLQQQLSKLGNTPFQMGKCYIDIDEIVMPIRSINQLRREAIDELSDKLMNKTIHNGIKNDVLLYRHISLINQRGIDVFVSNIEQLKLAVLYPVRYIYYPYQKDCLKAMEICKNSNIEMILFIPRIVKSNEIEEIKKHQIYQKIEKVIVNDIGSFYAMKDKERIIGTGLNCYNSYSLTYFNDYQTILSLEMSTQQINQLSSHNHIVQVYGKIENMVSEYCPISQYYFHKQIKHCHKCKEHHYTLIDRKKEKFDLMMDEKCRMHLLNNKTLYFIKLHQLKNNIFMLHFTNEDINLTKNILDDYFNSIFSTSTSNFRQNIDFSTLYF